MACELSQDELDFPVGVIHGPWWMEVNSLKRHVERVAEKRDPKLSPRTIGEEKRDAILSMLREYGPMTSTDISRESGMSPTSTKGHLKQLANEGRAIAIGHPKQWRAV